MSRPDRMAYAMQMVKNRGHALGRIWAVIELELGFVVITRIMPPITRPQAWGGPQPTTITIWDDLASSFPITKHEPLTSTLHAKS